MCVIGCATFFVGGSIPDFLNISWGSQEFVITKCCFYVQTSFEALVGGSVH